MNQVLHDVAATARLGWLLGATTLLFLTCFSWWVWWAFARTNRARFEEAAMLPLDGAMTGDDA